MGVDRSWLNPYWPRQTHDGIISPTQTHDGINRKMKDGERDRIFCKIAGVRFRDFLPSAEFISSLYQFNRLWTHKANCLSVHV